MHLCLQLVTRILQSFVLNFNYQLYKQEEGVITDLSHHCHDGNAVIKPEKGKAVLWYNHDVNPKTGKLIPPPPLNRAKKMYIDIHVLYCVYMLLGVDNIYMYTL